MTPRPRHTRRFRLLVRLLVFALLGAVLGPLGLAPVAPAAAQTVDRLEAFGAAVDEGTPGATPTRRLVGIAAHPGGGYWVAGSDGGVATYRNAPFFGSAGDVALAQPIVGMAARPDGSGYWLVASDGGVFSFGGSVFHGSTGGIALNKPIVGMASSPTGDGYWLVASDGGIFTFGDAVFHGSTGGTALNKPVVGMASSPTGDGYWLVASDGGIFTFGDAVFHGSAGALPLRSPVVAMSATPDGGGYWLAAGDGGVFTYGNAVFLGAGAEGLEPATAIATTVAGDGYWLLRSPRHPVIGPPIPANSGEGRRVIYSNGGQRVWLVGADGVTEHSYLVSGRRGVPSRGTYSVFSKSRLAYAAGNNGVTMRNMVRFAQGRSLAIGFHAIPRTSNGQPIQGEHDLGGYRSAGCVRQADSSAALLYEWAPLHTKVVVV